VAQAAISALQLGRDLDVQYKTAFVLAHKLREAMAAEHADMTLAGEVEVDGAYFGGYVRPENRKEDRRDRRLRGNQTGKRRVVVVMRERNGRTLPFVVKSEDHCRVTNGEQFHRVIAASMAHPVNRVWKGYWQRAA
jgi:hypothetical protein